MRTICSILLIALMLGASCAELRIGLSPNAEKQALFEARVEVCRTALSDKSAAAQEKWLELKASEQTEALAALAWSKEDAGLRERAIRTLARQSPSEDKNGTGLLSLASVAVAEGDGALRALARKALAARDDKRTANVLVGALSLDDALFKSNAVEALRDIGGPRVFEVIIEHWKEIWGASPRDHIFIGQQRSYIADYEISGSSYDPVVKNFMTGVVLDAKVLKVEGDAYYVWIREITGERKLPNDPAAWQRWLKKNEPALAKKSDFIKAAAVDYFKNE